MTPSPNGQPLDEILTRRVVILVGHFGAGKTEIAANLAFGARGRGETVSLVDLDVVKPYLRLRLLIDDLQARGIELVAPRGERFYADLPIVVPEVRAAVGHAAAGLRRVIVDVGGAEVGSRVLGTIPGLDDPALTDVLFIVNGRRPFAETPEAVVRMIGEVERASKLRVSGLVANTHLIDETTLDIVRQGLDLTRAVAVNTRLPIRFCAVRASLAAACRADDHGLPVLSIERHIMPPLDLRRPGSHRRSGIV
jgi:hypothetical protein